MVGKQTESFSLEPPFWGEGVREGLEFNTKIPHFIGSAKVKDTYVVKVHYLAK